MHARDLMWKSSDFALNRTPSGGGSLAGGLNFLKFELDLAMSERDEINEAMASFVVKAWPRLESFWCKKKEFGELLGIKKEEEFDEMLTTAGIVCGGTTRTRRRRDNVAILTGNKNKNNTTRTTTTKTKTTINPFKKRMCMSKMMVPLTLHVHWQHQKQILKKRSQQ